MLMWRSRQQHVLCPAAVSCLSPQALTLPTVARGVLQRAAKGTQGAWGGCRAHPRARWSHAQTGVLRRLQQVGWRQGGEGMSTHRQQPAAQQYQRLLACSGLPVGQQHCTLVTTHPHKQTSLHTQESSLVLAAAATRGQRSAHSLHTGPVMAEPAAMGVEGWCRGSAALPRAVACPAPCVHTALQASLSAMKLPAGSHAALPLPWSSALLRPCYPSSAAHHRPTALFPAALSSPATPHPPAQPLCQLSAAASSSASPFISPLVFTITPALSSK